MKGDATLHDVYMLGIPGMMEVRWVIASFLAEAQGRNQTYHRL